MMANKFLSQILLALGLSAFIAGCSDDAQRDLIANLKSPNAADRRAAAYALAKQDPLDNRAVSPLLHAISDSDPGVRTAIIRALAQTRQNSPACIAILVTALRDQDPPIRLQAALAIQKIDPSDADKNPVLITAMRVGDGKVLLAVGAAGKDSAWAVPTLIELLSHPTPQLRALAAQTIGRIGPAAVGAKPALQQATHDSNAAVQLTARQALEHVQAESKGSDK